MPNYSSAYDFFFCYSGAIMNVPEFHRFPQIYGQTGPRVCNPTSFWSKLPDFCPKGLVTDIGTGTLAR